VKAWRHSTGQSFFIAQVEELGNLINSEILFGEIKDSGPALGAELNRH